MQKNMHNDLVLSKFENIWFIYFELITCNMNTKGNAYTKYLIKSVWFEVCSQWWQYNNYGFYHWYWLKIKSKFSQACHIVYVIKSLLRSTIENKMIKKIAVQANSHLTGKAFLVIKFHVWSRYVLGIGNGHQWYLAGFCLM